MAKKSRCMVCGRVQLMEGSICDKCNAMIRHEAAEGQKKIRKDAKKELRKKGIPPEK